MKAVRKTAAVLLALIMLLSCFPLSAAAADHPFLDVGDADWYAENVEYVYTHDLMNGTAPDRFSPKAKMDRAMLVTVLYRMDGSNPASGSTPFTDVRSDSYYYIPLVWAYQNGIITGTAADKFSPHMPITREMMVTIFYRYAAMKGLDVSKTASLEGSYKDAWKISAYAKQPFRWAVQAGVIYGNTANTLDPGGTATRAECAAILQRFCGLEIPPEPSRDQPLLPGNPVSLMGKDTESFLGGGILYVRAEDFAQAFGLNLTVKDGKILLDGKALPAAGLCRAEGNYVPVLVMAQCLNYGVYVDGGVDNRTYVYTTSSNVIPKGVTVPVLMYHAVSDNIWGIRELFVSPSNMEAQLKYLVNNGYDPIFFSDLAHVDQYDKPVILTFDDGYDDNYTELFPLLKKYNVKATIFVITDYIGANHKMTAQQIKEMAESGLVSIQSHTATHSHLSELSEKSLEQEMERSQMAIMRITGIMPDVLCYPYGDYSALAKKVAARYYNFALIMGPGGYVTGSDPYVVGRYYVSRATTLGQFIGMVSGAGKKR